MWLTLIRHAEPAYVVDGIAWTDPPLTDRGRQQAEHLAKRASSWEVDELWVSTMIRADQTAEPLAGALGVEPTPMDWLRELASPPDWDGSPVDEVEEFLATAVDRPVEDLWEGPPGGESFREFHRRIEGGIVATLGSRGVRRVDGATHLWSGVDDRRVVVVAHAGTNALILGTLLGVEPVPWEWDRFTHVHSGVSRLVTIPTSGDHAWSLRSLSDRAHLPAGMVSG